MISEAEIDELKRMLFDPLDFLDENGDFLPLPDPRKFVDPSGDTALHYAATKGNLRAVELLVAAGVDVDSVGDAGYTPLHSAAASGHADVFGFLLSAGADPAIKNDWGLTPHDVRAVQTQRSKPS